jgi:hypothetical protein
LRDDGDVPLICPTCQNVFREQKSMPANPFVYIGFLSLHGVVFDILACLTVARFANEGWLAAGRARFAAAFSEVIEGWLAKP